LLTPSILSLLLGSKHTGLREDRVVVERADRNAKPVMRLLLDLCLHDLSVYNDSNEPSDGGLGPPHEMAEFSS
jgi:hypothetical protein